MSEGSRMDSRRRACCGAVHCCRGASCLSLDLCGDCEHPCLWANKAQMHGEFPVVRPKTATFGQAPHPLLSYLKREIPCFVSKKWVQIKHFWYWILVEVRESVSMQLFLLGAQGRPTVHFTWCDWPPKPPTSSNLVTRHCNAARWPWWSILQRTKPVRRGERLAKAPG